MIDGKIAGGLGCIHIELFQTIDQIWATGGAVRGNGGSSA
jgi:hypothetical protein